MLKLSGFWRHRNEEIAVVDLGSNSFHMIVAKVSNGQISTIDRLKEPVRLGHGLDYDGQLDDLSQKRALDCLERFHQRIKHLPSSSVRAVGTRTFRKTKNVYPFLAKAERALGYDIQIIAGAEEARLVYQGVAFGLEDNEQTRLVIDIGGGSTELIIGKDFTPSKMESLGMGCVSITKRFFDDGVLSKASVSAANIYCRQKLEPFQSHFRRMDWQICIGCSGSIKSISKVLEAQTGHPIITLEGLESLVAQCIEAGDLESLDLPGLSKQRKGVFIGGLVILRSCMTALKLSSIESSPWALREGVLFDLLGHDSISDMRERSVKELANRFHADLQHAERCNTVAQKLLAQVSQSHSLGEIWKRYLHWACLLLEIGLDINHDRFNVHSGYIVENCHLAGFGFEELHRLAFLVRNHRKKPDWTLIEKLPQSDQLEFILVMQVLRVAAVLTRARNDIQDIGWSLSVKNDTMTFTAPPPWWESQPLASADLKAEVRHVKKSPIPFKLG